MVAFEWLVPLLVVAFWILKIFVNIKGDLADKKKTSWPQRPAASGESRKSPEQLDDLIEEARRRQLAADEKRQREREKRRNLPVPPTVVRRAEPRIRSIRQVPELIVPALVAAPVAEVVTLELAPSAPVISLSPIPKVVAVSRPAIPAAIKNVRDFLRSRDSLKAALILREILDPPLSKRRRG